MPNAIRTTAALLIGLNAMLLPDAASALTIENVAPHLSSQSGVPMTMLNMSRDHQLFFKAYNDYSVLDRPGKVETTYRHSYVYYGYFNAHKCYVYERFQNQFNPVRKTDDRTCGGSGEWSGNFLNWASMTRMDIVRKILYGGYRVKDTSSETVLERAHLPNDAHAFAKWYKPGADGSNLNDDDENASVAIRKLTPFDVPEITLCNASPPAARPTSNYLSQNSNDLPLIRVVAGDFSLWAGNERFQCYFKEDGTPDFGNNNDVSKTGIKAASNNPSRTDGLGTGIAKGDYVARVRVCSGNADTFTLDEQKRCRAYPMGNAKPVGLLQLYGENNASEFGLITGSYDKNISGGVLRRNISAFAREVNVLTDGSFTAEKGIVHNLNRLRIYDYNYTDGVYIGCTFQRIGIGTGGPYSVNEGDCGSWGNPIGTMFLEALRYFSGATNPTSAFSIAAGSRDSQLGLTVEPWKDPLKQNNEEKYGLPACRKMNIVNFNASVNSYDFDSAKWSGFGNLPASPSIDSYTNMVGASEGMYDRRDTWLVGNSDSQQDDQCTPKRIGSLASVRGVCPEAPTYYGAYKIAGAALWAQTKPVRTDFTDVRNNPNRKPFRVHTYGVALSTAKPRIQIRIRDKEVVIQPTYTLLHPNPPAVGKGTLADFRIVKQTENYGKYIISWEDSEQGGDFDKDIVGILEYRVNGAHIEVTTSIINASSFNPQGFGYIISGTNKDGPHYHSGAYGFHYDDPTNIVGCNNCEANDSPTTARYTATGNAPLVPEDPLLYAAKYGNFHGNYVANQPLARHQWDRKNTVGQPAPDGLPDAYFFAIEPAELERSLESIFRQFASVGGAAPAVSATRLETGNKIYYSVYHSDQENADNYARGELRAYHLDRAANGDVSINRLAWEAGAKYPTNGNYFRSVRQVITNKGANGTPLAWATNNLTSQQMQMLSTSDDFGNVDLLGRERLNYLRGDRSKEAGPSRPNGFRPRKTILGDIINSGPWYVGAPAAGYTQLDNSGYPAFANGNAGRKPMIYVGANDGMLHAYDADTGVEAFSYMPSAVFPDLSKLTRQDYIMQPYVDGPVFAGDAHDGTAWRTFLIGALGRGGQSVFGLDVTNPQTFRESNAASLFRWEFTDRNDADLGYVIGTPTLTPQTAQSKQIVKMKVGSGFRWAVIFGNGYGSDRVDGRRGTGRAALFVVFLNKKSSPNNVNNVWQTIGGNGQVEYVKIPMAANRCDAVPPPSPAQEDCSGAGPDNGLGVPTPVDKNGDGVVDLIYAADLKGNVWKIKVDGAMDNWPDRSNVTRLYSAKDPDGKAQPISAAVSVIAHPLGGYMVNTVTGRSLQRADFPSTQTHTIYGIWDRPGAPLPVAGRSRLQKQSVATNKTPGGRYRYGASVDVDITTKSGWYFDLPEASEMGIFDPYVSAGSLIVDTLLQQASPDSCTGLTGTIINMFDPVTGKTPAATFDRDGDNLFTDNDTILLTDKNIAASGAFVPGSVSRSVRVAQPRGGENVSAGSEGTECASRYISTDTNGGTRNVTGHGCPPAGRIYWREVTRNLP